MDGHGVEKQTVAREAASVVVDTCMVAAAVSGASLLAWWSVSFHPSNSQLWMVPVGLVLACTPAVVFFALTLSSSAEPAGGGGGGGVQDKNDIDDGAKVAPFSVVVVESSSRPT